jgi:hypothetical protein
MNCYNINGQEGNKQMKEKNKLNGFDLPVYHDDYIMEKEELIQLIKSVFLFEPIPNDDDIAYGSSGEGIEKNFKGKIWYDLDKEFILENYDALGFFTDNALKYYLPAFMLATIRDYEEMDDVPARVVSYLTLPELADIVVLVNNLKTGPDPDPKWFDDNFMKTLLKNQEDLRKKFLGQMSIFNDTQCKTIIKYLKYMEQYKDDLYDDPKISYERYWRRFGYKGNGVFID